MLDADDGDGAAPHERAPVHLSPHVHPPRIPETCPFLSHFARSLSSPNKRAFLVLDNEDPSFFFFPPALPSFPSYHFRTFSIAAMTLLMSSFALLRVSARTDLPDIAAVGIIFLKLAGSSDTMQTVERTEAAVRLRGPMEQAREEPGCSCTVKGDLSPRCVCV